MYLVQVKCNKRFFSLNFCGPRSISACQVVILYVKYKLKLKLLFRYIPINHFLTDILLKETFSGFYSLWSHLNLYHPSNFLSGYVMFVLVYLIGHIFSFKNLFGDLTGTFFKIKFVQQAMTVQLKLSLKFCFTSLSVDFNSVHRSKL